MPPDPATRRPDLGALRASPCGMAHERITSGPDGLPLRGAPSTGHPRPQLCPAVVRRVNLGCSHTTARIALLRATEALGGDDVEALRAELRSLDAALGNLDHRLYEVEGRRADALRARDGRAASQAALEADAIIAEHRARGLRVGEIKDLFASRLEQGASGAARPGRVGEARAAFPAPSDDGLGPMRVSTSPTDP